MQVVGDRAVKFFSKTVFIRESVACKECARIFAGPVQNLLGFAAPRTRPSGYGKRWEHKGQAREARACDHLAYKNCTHPRMIIGWRGRECSDIIKDVDRL